MTEQVAAPAVSVTQQAPVGGGGGQMVAEQAVLGPAQRPVQASWVVTAQATVLVAASRVQHAPVGGGGGGGGTQGFGVQVVPGPRNAPWAVRQAAPVITEQVGAAPAAPGTQQAPVPVWAEALEAAPAQQTMAVAHRKLNRLIRLMNRAP
jgi:hypothetical protein